MLKYVELGINRYEATSINSTYASIALNKNKSNFPTKSIKFLDFLIDGQGIFPDDAKFHGIFF